MLNVTIYGRNYSANYGTLLSDLLIELGYLTKYQMICKGKGKCLNCSVEISYDNISFSKVPSCITPITSDITVRLIKPTVYQYRIDTDINASVRLGLAVDIGTTTFSMTLHDLDNKTIKGIYIADNPQKDYGADVMSRIDAFCNGKDLRKLIIDEIMGVFGHLKIETMVISANTVMQHIFIGADLSNMRGFPFCPDERYGSIINSRFDEIPNIDNIIIMPYVGAFFGADALLGIICASKMPEKLNSYLFIDLGTNSELAVVTPKGIICTAAAAGSAMLGSFKGSELIKLIAYKLKEGVIDETGRLSMPCNNLTQEDIRSFQLAKAAISAGIKIILNEAEIEYQDISAVYISGQFGENTDPNSLKEVGIIDKNIENIVYLGNTSLKGAQEYLYNNLDANTIAEYISKCRYINMNEYRGFNDIFVDEMGF